MDANIETPARALAIGAHPDDIEFGCGGTFAKWAAAGCEIFHLVCTDGSKGSWDPSTDRSELVVTRQHEQRAASRALGGKGEVVFLGWPDGELESGLRQRSEVCRWIRELRPDVVLGHDPWKRYRIHPDHRNAGFLVTDGVVAARDPHFFPEQKAAPHRPKAILLFEADEPDHIEDVSGFVDAKIAALLEHRSQLLSTMAIETEAAPGAGEDGLDSRQLAAFRAEIAEELAGNGAPHGMPAGELFRMIGDL
ncbi:MAG TPA: PIG-L deacetylase family protein [Acidimicrobiales bacterium]|nr:PIG-L deacetylase family protein [Acidimicrobiales bacterium]